MPGDATPSHDFAFVGGEAAAMRVYLPYARRPPPGAPRSAAGARLIIVIYICRHCLAFAVLVPRLMICKL